ncbi:UDP-Glycosyltransferase/glycogen phosphorylase [Marasmius fiardii PR-910]|nr:UDP-Glycosyltransferase/glycogen phosphorylase [Marasmius fiardii PR-910]
MAKHIVLYSDPAWGHVKPLVTLMVLVAELRADVVLTFIANTRYPNIMDELAKIPPERFENIRDRVHVMNIPNPSAQSSGPSKDDPGFTNAFGILWRAETLTCVTTGKTITGLPRPSLAIIDPFAGFAIDAIRSLASPKETPIFSFASGPVGTFILGFGPESLGGPGDLGFGANNEKEVSETVGEEEDELKFEDFTTGTGKIVSVPGYPPIFDYELFVQDVDYSSAMGILPIVHKALQTSEGILFASASCIESEAINALKEHYTSQLGKELVPVGIASSVIPEPPLVKDEGGVVPFLNEILKEHGEKSLIYVAFGTQWWPKDPAKIYILIDELIRTRTPFLFSQASPRANMPSDLTSKIADCGLGKVVKWAPQDTVLQHPATGWFITHGGWNSVQEGFRYKVPLIFWPMAADQPLNAVLFTLKYKTGFELISVRTGKNTKRPYRCDVEPSFTVEAVRGEVQEMLLRIRSEEGNLVRKNTEELSEVISNIWKQGGEAMVEIEGFLKKFVDSP